MSTSRQPGQPAGVFAPLARLARAWADRRSDRIAPAPLVEELEARLLYAADPAGAGLALAGAVVEQRLLDDGGEFRTAAPLEQRRHELLIVGAGIADSRMLLDSLAGDGRDFDVLELDPAQDSLDQISAALAGRHDLSAIHILSHGASGQLQLGAETLDTAMLAARAGEVGRWGDALRPGGDILLYGCDVAAGETGAAFVRQFAALTGADVAASDNLTGSSSQNGDWTLELRTGGIESATAFSAAAQAQWQGTLEIRANAVTQDKQHGAAVAVSPTGSFVLTWTADHDQDGNNTGIFGQRFDSAGNPVGGQFQVNTATQDRQESSAVGMAADGSFVVVWASHNQQAGDTDSWGVKAQRFDSEGRKIGTEFLVNQGTAKDQWQPSIAVSADGQFVIAWASSDGNDIYVRHYDAAGNSPRGEVLASSVNGSGNQTLPSVGIAADGSYIVAWQTDSGGSAKSIYAQRFNANDTLRGSGFMVNTYDAGDQTKPTVAMNGAGAFVIAWTSARQDGDAGGIYAQLYRADGTRQGGEFRVNTVTAKDQSNASAAMDGAGNFTIAWNSAGQDNGPSLGVFAQRYSAAGAALGDAFLVNSTTAGNQSLPAAAMNANGALVIGWEGAGIDDNDGVFAALYKAGNAPPVANPDVVDVAQGGQASAAGPGVLANDTDPDSGATLSVAGLISPADGSILAVTAGGTSVVGLYGTLTLRSDGSYLYSANSGAALALAAGQSGSDVFTYLIRDDGNADASSTLSFTVHGLNDAPVAADDAYAVDRYGSLTVPAAGVLANDSDIDRNPADLLRVVSVNGAPALVGASVAGAYGSLRLAADGSLSYVPDSMHPDLLALLTGRSVTDTFRYEVSDGASVTSATIRITIQASNSAPVAADDSGAAYTVQQDGSLVVAAGAGVLKNDFDPDDNVLSAQLASGPAHGALTLNADGSFVYKPNPGYSGSDSFTYRASDGSLNSAAATVTLTIVHVNHDPVAADDGAQVIAGASVVTSAAQGLLANDSDIDRDSGDQIAVVSIQYGDQVIALAPGGTGSITTDYGTLTVGSDGAFRYVADGAASLRLGAGAVTSDSFGYAVSDGRGGMSTARLLVDITGINEAPVILMGAGAGAGQAVSDQGSLQPFSGVTISDADSPEQQLTVRVALDDPAKGMLIAAGGGSYDAASGIYTFTGTAAQASAAVGALVFVPSANRVQPGALETTRFTITADDGLAISTDASTTVNALSINDAPVITGAISGQAVDDNASLRPFAAVTIADADSPDQLLTVQVRLDDPGRGSLSGMAGAYDAGAGIYTFTGTAAEATLALRTLTFTPAANRLAPGLSESTRLTINVSDGYTTVTDASTTIVATSVNDAPTISNAAAGQLIDDTASLRPFAAVTIADADSPAQLLTVQVRLDDPARGMLSGGAGRYDAATGIYTLTATAADASASLRSLLFTPAPNRVSPSLAETSRFLISVSDGAVTTTDATTTVLSLSVNDAPTVTGLTLAQAGSDKTGLRPFSMVIVNDADSPAQLLTVRVTLDDPIGGRLSGAGGSYDAAAGVWLFAGTAAEAGATLRALVFTPAENRVAPGASETALLRLAVDDGQAAASANLRIEVTSVNDAPVLGLPAGVQTVRDKDSLAPLAGMTVADADSPAQQLTLRVALDDPAKGSLSAAAGSYDAATGVYTLTGTAAQLNAATQALLFRPVENRLAPGQTETVAFSVRVSDGALEASGSVLVDTLSVNDAPVALAASARGTQDGGALAILLAASDADADALVLAIATAPAHGTLYLDRAATLPLLPGARLPAPGNTAQIYFVPEPGWNGDTGFTYAAVDAHGLAGASVPVSIAVAPAVRSVAQAATVAATTDVPAAPAAGTPARAEEAAAAPQQPTQVAALSAAVAPAGSAELAAAVPETVLPATLNPPPAAPAAAPARSSADRAAQAAAAMPGMQAALAAGDAAFAADLAAAQALGDARMERASAAARSETLTRSLDDLRDNVKAAEEAEQRIVGSSVAVGASFSVGYVIWLLRGGVLATSLLSSLPAWRFVDPLPVLARMRAGADDEEGSEESLESLVANAGQDERPGAYPLHATGIEK